MVIGFPPTSNKMEYVKEDCLRYLYDSGPVDIGLDFTAVDTLVLSNLTRSSFQYNDYWKLIHNYKKFYEQWLTLDMLQFHHCWVSRSIGCYPKNIFLLPLDYYQADIEDIFEEYFNEIESAIKVTFVKHMWRYIHPASHHRHKVNMWKKNWSKLPSSNQQLAGCSLGFQYFQAKDYLFQLQKCSALRHVCLPQRQHSDSWLQDK
jgi:hypothetical protein